MAVSVQLNSLRAKHHFIIDRLIAEPTIKMEHLAAEVGVTRSWLSVVMQSDVFKEEYTKRRMEHSKDMSRQVAERQLRVALKALDKLEMILDDDEVEDRLVLDTASQTAKALGFSPSSGSAPQVEITERETIRQVAPGVVERARERIRRFNNVSEDFFEGNARALPSTDG